MKKTFLIKGSIGEYITKPENKASRNITYQVDYFDKRLFLLTTETLIIQNKKKVIIMLLIDSEFEYEIE